MSNLDEDFITWLAGAFPHAHELPRNIRMALEMSFFAGAAQAREIACVQGAEALTPQFAGHIARLDQWHAELSAAK